MSLPKIPTRPGQPRPARLLAAAVAVAVAAAVVVILFAGLESVGRRSPPDAGQALIRDVPDSFLGISTEYGSLSLFERHGPLFDRVLALLRPPGAGPLIVRVGGTSADGTLWDPSSRRLPHWAYGLTPAWLAQTGDLVRRVGARLILDLNLATATPLVAARLAAAAERRLPRGAIVGFEIGNEPDNYDGSHWLAGLAHAGLRAAGPASEISRDRYVRDFEAYAQRLRPIARRAVLVGPGVAYPRRDVDWISTLLSRAHPGLGIVSAHIYPYTACAAPGSEQYPTIARLLSENATAGLARLVRPAVDQAHRAGLVFRLTELNSVSCGGRPGVSNAFVTALWAPDALFELLQAGVDGVNLHLREDAINGAFALIGHGLTARPLLYGLILFARMLGRGAELVHVKLRAPHSVGLKVWAVRLADGVTHVLVINKSNRSANVALDLPAIATATLQRLRAPSADSRFGVTLDGQHLGSDGRWRGRPAGETITRGADGYALTVGRFSAALIGVRPANLTRR
jgi:hypothetical protein